MKQIDYINGLEVNEPNNYTLNEIDLNFDPRQASSRANLSINSWELGTGNPANPSDAMRIAKAHLLNGLTGGVGVTEGLPYRKTIRHGTQEIELFNGYLDLWTAKYEREKITARAVEKGKLGWLESGVADVTFEYLEDQGFITESMYIMVPYVRDRQDNSYEAFMAIVTVFIVIDKISDQIQGILELTAEAANPFEASSIARLVLRVVYIAVLLATLIKLIIDVFNLLVQPVKYHACMFVKDLFIAGCNYLGLTFSSSIFIGTDLENAVIMPRKFNTKVNTGGVFAAVKGLFTPDKTDQKGYPSYGYTFSDLLNQMQNQCNAKIVCTDGINLRFEKKNFSFSSSPLYKIPAVERSEFSLNEEDFYSNFVLQFLTDLNDKNTLQEYLGTIYQVQIQQAATMNPTMRLTKRLKDVRFGFARGVRKTELSFIEKIFDAFFKVADATITVLVDVINAIIKVLNEIIKILNKIIKALSVIGIDIKFEIPPIKELEPPSFGNLIEDRLDMLKMENDFVDVPKLLLVGNNTNARNNKLLPNHETVLSAKYFWDNFWFLESFVPQPGNELGNQWKIYPVEKVNFAYEDYLKVRANNLVEDTDGTRIGKIDTWKFNIDGEYASGIFRINETYTKNLIEIKFEPNGI